MRHRSLITFLLVCSAAAPGLGLDEDGSDPTPEPVPAPETAPGGGRVLRLTVADVGRLALRNDPRYGADALAPSIARTFEDEALAEFDTMFTSRAGFTERQSEVFFDPTGRGGSDPLLVERELSGSVGVRTTEQWGGTWQVDYGARSTDRSGAASIQSLSPRYDGSLSLGYTHPLLRGAGTEARLLRTREAGRRTAQAGHALYRNAEMLVAQAEDIYWLLVGATADREVRRKSLDVARELLSVSRARLDSGRGTAVDVTEARSGVARREVDLIAAINDVENMADRLRELVMPFTGETQQLDLDLIVEAADAPGREVSDNPEDPTESAVRAAMERRADARALASAVDAARLAEDRAEDDTLYTLDAVLGTNLRGQGTGFSDSSTRIGDRREYDWDAGLELTIPLGNRQARARLRRARRERLQAERSLAALGNTIVREIREATRNVRSSADRIAAAVRARVAAEEQLDAERSRLQNGRSTPFRVLDVEEDLTQATAQEIRARVDYERARVALGRSTGTLLASRQLEHLVERD